MAEPSREENEGETEHSERDTDDIERVVAPQLREIKRNDRGRDRKPGNAHFALGQKVHLSPVRLVCADPLLCSSFKGRAWRAGVVLGQAPQSCFRRRETTSSSRFGARALDVILGCAKLLN